MGHRAFSELSFDRQYRIEGSHRLLEDHRDAFATYLLKVGGRKSEYAAASQEDTPLDPSRGRSKEPKQGEGSGALAAAGFSHKGEHFAAGYPERDVVDCHGIAVARLERNGEIYRLEHLVVCCNIMRLENLPHRSNASIFGGDRNVRSLRRRQD
ncbi:hypothetical protein GCM10023067_01750 [Aminobacter aganoensis]